jgi:hypothetical protein
MLHHLFGRPPGQRTMDVDLGIVVRDWDLHRQMPVGARSRVDYSVVFLRRLLKSITRRD